MQSRRKCRVRLDGWMAHPALGGREKEKVKATSLGWGWEMLKKERPKLIFSRALTLFLHAHTHTLSLKFNKQYWDVLISSKLKGRHFQSPLIPQDGHPSFLWEKQAHSNLDTNEIVKCGHNPLTVGCINNLIFISRLGVHVKNRSRTKYFFPFL